MKTQKKICEGCNRLSNLWKGKLCKICSMKANPPKKIAKYSEKGLENKKKKTENTKKLHLWFQELWNKKPHYSEVSNTYLGESLNICCLHHIFPKSKYREYEFDEDNIVFLTSSEHTQVEANPYYYKVVNKKRWELQLKYGLKEPKDILWTQISGEEYNNMIRYTSENTKKILNNEN